ncbi:MAG: hypothetical protein WAL67_15685 [Candidatus Cybelea sp.]
MFELAEESLQIIDVEVDDSACTDVRHNVSLDRKLAQAKRVWSPFTVPKPTTKIVLEAQVEIDDCPIAR